MDRLGFGYAEVSKKQPCPDLLLVVRLWAAPALQSIAAASIWWRRP